MEPLATLDDLKGRLDWTLDADEERVAEAALEDASDMARHYAGRDDWYDAASAPRMARTLVLKACKRHMNNASGYTQSRAGDETLGWNDSAGENAGTVYFTADEIKTLAGLGGRRPTLGSVPIVAWEAKPVADAGLVPVDYEGGDPFPFFADPSEPW